MFASGEVAFCSHCSWNFVQGDLRNFEDLDKAFAAEKYVLLATRLFHLSVPSLCVAALMRHPNADMMPSSTLLDAKLSERVLSSPCSTTLIMLLAQSTS